MPTTYFWPVSGTASSGAASASSAAPLGTGVGGTRPYSFSRKMEPLTGDAVFDAARRSWSLGAPVMERVLRCLRTERGTAARDPRYGVDWSPVDNARANAGAAAKQAITAALKSFVDAGDLVGLVVEVDVAKAASGRAMIFKLSFSDARGLRFAAQGNRT